MNGWEWPELAALGVSLVALVLSGMAYRQRIKYHPQPRLEVVWDRAPLTHFKVPVHQVGIVNHGDAAANDLDVVLRRSARGARSWDHRDKLDPGETWWVMIPLATKAEWHYGGMGLTFVPSEHGEPTDARFQLGWRQAPFAKGKRRQTYKPPRKIASLTLGAIPARGGPSSSAG